MKKHTMRTMTTYQRTKLEKRKQTWKRKTNLTENIRIKQNLHSGIWYITHPLGDGKRTTYSTGIRGSVEDVKCWVKESKISDIIAVGVRTGLTSKVVSKLTQEPRKWDDMISEFFEWMENVGRSYLTIGRYESAIDRFLKDMGISRDSNVCDVTAEQSYNWVNHVLKCRLSTRKTLMSALKTFFGWMHDNGYIERDVMKRTAIRKEAMPHAKKERKEVSVWTKEEFDDFMVRLDKEIAEVQYRIAHRKRPTQNSVIVLSPNSGFKVLEPRLRFFASVCRIAWALGLRRGDVTRLEWDSLARDGWVIVHTGKSDTRIAVPYGEKEVEMFLEDLVLDEEEQADAIRQGLLESAEYLREGIRRIPVEDSDMTHCFPKWKQLIDQREHQVSQSFSNTLRRCGIGGKNFHGLRHGRIRRWKDMGISLEHIGLLVAHAHTNTTKIYLGDESKAAKRPRLQVSGV